MVQAVSIHFVMTEIKKRFSFHPVSCSDFQNEEKNIFSIKLKSIHESLGGLRKDVETPSKLPKLPLYL